MTTTPTPSQPPLSAGAVLELPVVGYLDQTTIVFSFHRFDPAIALTPHAPAQATINAQAAEIERLKRERDEARHEVQAVSHRWNWDAESTGARIIDLEKELTALKAKQVAEADEVMRLADEYASTEAQNFYATEELGYMVSLCARRLSERDAAREALRAAVTKDRT